MTARPRALVVGGSVGGLFSSHLLRRSGWDVTVFERSAEDLASRGVGIGLTDALLDVLREIDVPIGALRGITMRSRLWLDRSGAIRAEVPIGTIVTSWARIYRALKDALPLEFYRAATPVVRVDPQPTSVTAVFADGSQERGELLVAGDGIHSTVRRQFLPEALPRYAGYVTWRGVVDEADVAPELRAQLSDRVAFCFHESELFLAMPNPGNDGDIGRRFYFAWYRPVDYEKALPELCTDASGHQHGVSIPPHLIRREIIDDVKRQAGRIFEPSIAALVRSTKQILLLPVFDLESPRMVFGRVALLGDAAFVARPHVVAGVTKAALDAQALAEALNGIANIDQALARFEAGQQEFGRRLVERGRRLGAFLEAADCGGNEGAFWGPDIVFREYGAGELIAERRRAASRPP